MPAQHLTRIEESMRRVSSSREVPGKDQGMEPQNARPVDVAVLGGGLVGSLTAMCLARQGHTVALLEAGRHPRFAVGETMTPEVMEWLQILRYRFDIPELEHLFNIKETTRHIGPHHGKMQGFGFVRHVAGQEPEPDETTLFGNPTFLPVISHLYRQETDQFYFNIATRYGVITRQDWFTKDLQFDDAGITVKSAGGEVFRARYLIDASGFHSPIVEKLDLREDPAPFKHHSRALFAHYIGVKPFDDVSHHPRSLRPPVRWHEGTLHHTFERGWFWIIPFDNIDESTNPLVSVGLVLDPRYYPKPDRMTPEEEFTAFLERYPAVRRQFEGARRVNDWVSTDRLQYSSKQMSGHRWSLMSQAAGFVDPLFARGLPSSLEVAHALIRRVDQALKDDDFSTERFAYVEELQRGLMKFSDTLANSAAIAFGNFRLWHAFFRVWGGFRPPGVMRLTNARVHYQVTHDIAHLDALEAGPHQGMWWPESDVFTGVLESAANLLEKYEAGKIGADTAADRIFAMTRESAHVPAAFGWKKGEDTRFILPTPAQTLRFMYWITRQAPADDLRPLGRSLLSALFQANMKGVELR